MILLNKLKSIMFPIFLLLTIGFTIYTLSWSYYKFRLSNYGLVAQATIETVSSYKMKNSRFYRWTAKFTDVNGYTYSTYTIETSVSMEIGEQVTIVYDKYAPQRADWQNNKITRDNIIMYWIGVFILMYITLHSYYHFYKSRQ